MSSSVIEREVGGKREMTEGLAAQILHHIRINGACRRNPLDRPGSGAAVQRFPFSGGPGLAVAGGQGRSHPRAEPRLLRVGRRDRLGRGPWPFKQRRNLPTSTSESPTITSMAACPTRCRKPTSGNSYGVTKSQLVAVLNRIAQEGWAERRPGYGWSFSPMLSTPESLEQTYRVRLALEPAALMEPTYHLDPETAARCRAAESRLLAGAIETDSADALTSVVCGFTRRSSAPPGNPFFLETVRRINRVRRLLSYRSMVDRKRYRQQCEEHLQILDLLEAGRNGDASRALRRHLKHTVRNLTEIRSVLEH